MKILKDGDIMNKRFISWNVNGIRAVLNKNFMEFFANVNADIFAIQESKCQSGQVNLELEGYYQFWNYAGKKGYSGTAIFTKELPISYSHGLNIPKNILNTNTSLIEQKLFEISQDFIAADSEFYDEKEIVEQMESEGRVITLEFEDYYFVTVYTPNSQNALKRLAKRQIWNEAFRLYIKELDQVKPVILCGDLNVAHNEIDLKNPESNHMNAGFSDEERADFTKLLDTGFTDTFRYFMPEAVDRYSWWSYRTFARSRNAGWRIDYFLTSAKINNRLARAEILDQVMGSDHCPVILELKI